MGWTPGMPDPKFYELKAAIQHLPSSSSREHATQILSVVYERYDPLSPSQFLFNRHGLLHGVRGPDDVDEMNCARMFTLFDTLCDAEGLYKMLVHDDEFRLRHSAYKNCIKTGNEQKLLKEIARAEKTVAAYRLELATRSQEHEPLQWARTQRDLGDALITLVERGGGVSDFKEAKAAYRAALKVQAPEPLEWARTQTSMATLFAALGKRQKSSNWLKRAVGLYRVALGKLTPKSAPREWATAQNNLAHALEEWGVLSGDSALFVEAAKAWDECLAAAPEVWPEKLVEYVKSRLAGLRRRN
jgi:tetratricopeptide (TPR) repeat protein